MHEVVRSLPGAMHRKQREICLALSFLLCVTSHPLWGQSAPLMNLKASNGRLAEEFSGIASIRELANGSVLLVDRKENRIVSANMSTGAVTALGRIGDGPAEFRRVGILHPMRADTTLMVDGTAERWLLIVGTKIIATLPPTDPRVAAVGGSGIQGTDANGNVVMTRRAMPMPSQQTAKSERERMLAESLNIVRIDRLSGRAESVSRFPSQEAAISGGMVEGPLDPHGAKKVFDEGIDAGEGMTIFPDGWIAVVRGYPSRIDWCSPLAKCVAGPTLPIPRNKVTDADKRAWLAWEAASNGWLPAGTEPDQISPWPVYLPAFRAAAFPAPDGQLLVQRFPHGGQAGNEYVMIDRRGAITGRLVLPIRERVAGFGVRSIYIVARDADGLEQVRRHPWR